MFRNGLNTKKVIFKLPNNTDDMDGNTLWRSVLFVKYIEFYLFE